jgi:eukaryotic-like serine/threonine-protein kinase
MTDQLDELLKPGQILAKTYRVEHYLASGGYAVVYVGTRLSDNTSIVIKGLRAEAAQSDPAAVERFIREAAIAAHLQHPNIVRILDFGNTRGSVLYIILELLDGEPLSNLMYQGPMSPDFVQKVLVQVLRALVSAHDQGIIHRDIKPSNIFICNYQVGGELGEHDVKILDFGFVKVTREDHPFSRRLTMVGQQVGTPGYMAPELLTDANSGATPQVDLYAVGVLGYEMITGSAAFQGRGAQRALAQINSDPEPPPESIRNLPIYKVIKRLMDRNPARRYPLAAEALRDIEDNTRNRSGWLKFWGR